MIDYVAEAKDPRLTAGVELLGRTGASSFQLRYSDDEEPVIWMAGAEWRQGFECAAATSPLRAVLRLLDRVIDGGKCVHCQRPTGVTDDFSVTMPVNEVFCWYVYDPELKTFRRSCEGDAERRVGRNDPCPCGSGEKFKRCHGR